MNKYILGLLGIVVTACIVHHLPTPESSSLPALFPEIDVTASMLESDTDKGSGADSIAYAAIDRQCGSCHHGDRSTNTRALAIFDLRDTCWYCTLTPEQGQSLRGRISGATFTDTERTAIVALIAHLAGDDSSTH